MVLYWLAFLRKYYVVVDEGNVVFGSHIYGKLFIEPSTYAVDFIPHVYVFRNLYINFAAFPHGLQSTRWKYKTNVAILMKAHKFRLNVLWLFEMGGMTTFKIYSKIFFECRTILGFDETINLLLLCSLEIITLHFTILFHVMWSRKEYHKPEKQKL